MADLTESQSAEAVKLIGSDSSGAEATYVASSLTGELYTADILRGTALYSAFTVGTSAVEVKVGASVLTNRKIVLFQNLSSKAIYFGFNSSVTTASGLLISGGNERTFEITDSIHIWVISAFSGIDCRIAEVS